MPEWEEAAARSLGWRGRRRLARDALRLRASPLFDAAWYAAQHADAIGPGHDPVLHYLVAGAREGRDPGPAFSTDGYNAANPDVAVAGLNPLAHYLAHGRAEHRPLAPAATVAPAAAMAPAAAVGAPAVPGTFAAAPPKRHALPRLARAVRPWLRPLLRPRRVLQPSLPDGFGDIAGLHPLDGHAPTGWALVRLPQGAGAGRLALRVQQGSVLREIDLGAADGRREALVRLPALPAQLGLGCGVRSGLRVGQDGLPDRFEVREIGRLEALVRLLRTHGWGWRDLLGAARGPGLVESLRGLAAAHMPAESSGYRLWIEMYDSPSRGQVAAMRAQARAMPDPPRFSVIVPAFDTPALPLREMIGSVRAQVYPHWELCVADDASTQPHVRAILREAAAADPRIRLVLRERNGNISAASNSALALATGDFAALLDHDDVLPPHALLTMAHAIRANPRADILYSDEDKLDSDGHRYDPYFKPDYSPELLAGQNFISHLGVYRLSMLRELGGLREGFEGSQDYDLALRMAARTRGPVVHVPHILYHWRVYPGAGTFSTTQLSRATLAARRAIREQAASLGESVEVVDGVANYHRVVRAEPQAWPLVSAIVPTRDHLDVLRDCIDGLLHATDYPALEVVVVDNASSEPETLAYLAQLAERGVRVLSWPGAFNYSAINNFAATAARGDILLLLNSDVSMPSPGWLRAMVQHATRRGVGAVGARLLYPDGTVQHAGVVLGLGGAAGHTHVGSARDDPGHFGQLMMEREVSAATAACLAVPRAAFEAVGGLDAEHLPVAFNDVDLCLRLRERGYRIVWTPHAELIHHESKSRGSDFTPERIEKFHAEVAYMTRRWGAALQADPFYNPNLSLSHARPTPAFPPRIARPWDAPPPPPAALGLRPVPETAAAL